MKTTPRLTLRILLCALLFGLLLTLGAHHASAASATPPDRMSYQGYLVDVNGAPLATNLPANYAVVFRIYDASTGGNILWSEQQTVTVDKGNFSVVLGEGTVVSGEPNPALSTVFVGATASDRYLGITVTISGTTMTISPRLRLLPSPYAFTATKAMSIDAQSSSRLSGNQVYLGSGTDVNNGLGYFGTFGGASVGGPALFGASGGVLGTVANNGTNQTGALFWNSSGYVGIGTASPGVTLEVNGGIRARGGPPGALGTNNNGYAFIGNGGDNDSGMFSSADGQIEFYSNSSERMRITPQGYVAIRSTGAVAPLTVFATNQTYGVGIHIQTANNNEGPRLEFDRTGVKAWGIGIAQGVNNSAFGVFEDANAQIGYGTPRLSIKSGGWVGIGTDNPTAPLDVRGEVALVKTYYYLASIGTGSAVNSTGGYTILAANRVGAVEFNAFSDARIKKVVGLSDGRRDLETIQKLRVTDYSMVDHVAEGNDLKKGFIAQEVKTVIPEAVTTTRRFVPDIYSVASGLEFDKGCQTLGLTVPKAHGLKIGDRVRIFADEADMELSVVAVPSAERFVVEKCEKPAERVFVYGKEVSDFHNLHYDRIFTTGIGAIQELARRVESLESREARVAELEKKAARVDTLEREVAELRRLVTDLASAARTAPAPVAAVVRDGRAVAVANR